jgi:uncharacterized ion transporter superfamily protein YfcC
MSHAGQAEETHKKRWALDPVMMMFAALAVAIGLTWTIPSGQYQRKGGAETSLVIPGTYQEMQKEISAAALMPPPVSKASKATEKMASGDVAEKSADKAADKAPENAAVVRPVSPAAMVTAIPVGLAKSSSLIFMFGVLRTSGALDAGIERLLAVTGGRVGIVTPVVMIAISAGSTFLGLISEYLLIIPIVIALAERMGCSRLYGFAMLTLAAKVGYLASVSNPVALLIAQPIVGVPVFSGAALRFAVWAVFLLIAIVVVLRLGKDGAHQRVELSNVPLSSRQLIVLLTVASTVALLIFGSASLGWRDVQFASLFVVAAVVMGIAAGMTPRQGAHAFVDGMKSMMLAALLIGMARGVELVLRDGHILDTIIAFASHHVEDLSPIIVAPLVMLFEMFLTLLIPSTSAKAALSIPILGPIAQTVGVSGQTTVLAFLLGNGLVNMFAPTSGMLLAYLATAGIPYSRWFRFVLPIFGIFTVLSIGVTMLAVVIGY